MELLEYFRTHPGAQIELAQKLNVTPSYLSMIAHGHRIPAPEVGGRVSLQSINASLARKFRQLCQAGLIQYALISEDEQSKKYKVISST
jgi:transcriptional regulator with XRE-family HTH domain